MQNGQRSPAGSIFLSFAVGNKPSRQHKRAAKRYCSLRRHPSKASEMHMAFPTQDHLELHSGFVVWDH